MISIILPTVRPEQLYKCLHGITIASQAIDIEILVISDYEPNLSDETIENLNIKWVYEPERNGVVDAIKKGFNVANGDYLLSLSDEALLGERALNYLIEHSEKLDNRCILTPKHIPQFPFFYYKMPFAPFPFVHRSVIDELDGIYIDTAYKAFYADPDLSLRALTLSIPVYTCEKATIFHPNNMACPAHVHNVNKYLEKDRATFRARWDHLGDFVDP